MRDDEIELLNTCTDLVTLRQYEAFPRQLLAGKGPGEWVGVRALCLQIGVAPGALTPEVFATWLPDPKGRDAYVVILFYDDESKWSMGAQYNRGRLSGGAPPEQARVGLGVPVAPSPPSPSERAAPASER